MSFRNNAYATIWAHKDNTVQLSTSRKLKDEYITDFSDGFVRLMKDAKKELENILDGMSRKELADYEAGKKPIRVQLKSVDVTTSYDKKKKKNYTNFTVWDMVHAE